jgi:hypothetical protein
MVTPSVRVRAISAAAQNETAAEKLRAAGSARIVDRVVAEKNIYVDQRGPQRRVGCGPCPPRS